MRTKIYFEKVSYEQFKKDWIMYFPEDRDNEEYIRKTYDNIKLPQRATMKSAGYDFFLPMDVTFPSGMEMTVPTGISCMEMSDDEVLCLFPRSGLGSKYRFVIKNSVSIIDADYVESDNEGHIYVRMVNDGGEDLSLDAGQAFCQGIIFKYGITADDSASGIRNGGMGSTDNSRLRLFPH